MRNVTKLPKFMPGQVVDLSYKSKGLPNRLLIQAVFTREHDNQWMYQCIIESTGESTTLNEDFIVANMTHKASEVYKCKEIINLYNTGWRFCGNKSKSTAHSIAGKHATNRYVRSIILRPALAPNGCLLQDHYGIWIKYNNIINDDGTVIMGDEMSNDVVIIK